MYNSTTEPANPHLTPAEAEEWANLNAQKKKLWARVYTGIAALAGMVLLSIWSVYQAYQSGLYNPVTLIVYGAILCLAYGGCALYATYKPLTAMTVAISILVGFYILFALVNSANLVHGVWGKLIAFGLLLRARAAADQMTMIDSEMEILAEK